MTNTNRRPLNPYDFVPLEEAPTYITRRSMSRAYAYSGIIRFRIRTLTPLFIHRDPSTAENDVYAFASLQHERVIAATSLKGMLRSVHEAVSNSTMGLLASEQRGAFYRRRVPAEYRPGERGDCRTSSEVLFGMVGGSSDSSVGYAGRVLLSDIAIPSEHLVEIQLRRPSRGGAPQPQHESFYFEDVSPWYVLGRKFYYHQDERKLFDYYDRERRRSTELVRLQAVERNCCIDGALRFMDLEEVDLALLVYALILEPELAHKLGFGKPIGLGSIQIDITEIGVEMATGEQSRFRTYAPDPLYQNWTDRVGELREMGRAAWLGRGSRGVASYAAFRAVARWQTSDIYAYPDYSFFQVERGRASKTTLWAYQQRAQRYPQAAIPGGAPQAGATPTGEPAAGEGRPLEEAEGSPLPQTRIRGELARSDGYVVFVRREDYSLVTKEQYQVYTGGANRSLLKRIASNLDGGDRIPISFTISTDGLADALRLEEDA